MTIKDRACKIILDAINEVSSVKVDSVDYGLNTLSDLAEAWGDCYMQGAATIDGNHYFRITFTSNCRVRELVKRGCAAIGRKDERHYELFYKERQ